MTSEGRPLKVTTKDPRLERALGRLCRLVADAGGRALLVGGSVRDALLGRPAEDLDFEVFGLEPQALETLLQRSFSIDLVGKAFGVLKIRGLPIDVALPRRESKAGLGHRAFEVLSDPWMDVAEAQSRRDFTINAIYHDPLSGELIDHFGGRRDLEDRVLRHTSEKFVEDPLRVLRGMQFAARLDLTPAAETVALCRTIEPEGLAAERLWGEWKKLVLDGVTPSRGLTFLRDTGWVRHYPELDALIGLSQDPVWHPEGDVWTHTLECMDVFAAERLGDDWEDLVVGFAVLCHDLGKATTTTTDDDGRVRALGHEAAGEAPTRAFLSRLTNHRDLPEQVVPLVVRHLAPGHLFAQGAGDAAVRRLARKVGRLDRLVRVARADALGRGAALREAGVFEAGDWLLARAEALGVRREKPKALVQGRHLIELGEKPGPHFGPLLRELFEAQLDGAFDDLEGGLEAARALLANR